MAVCALAGLLGWTPASAESFVPQPGPSALVLDSNPQSGKVSTWKIGDLGSINAIRATVRVHRLDYDPFKTPAFAVTLAGGDYKAVFDIVSLNFRPPLFVRLEHWVGGAFRELQAFPFTLNRTKIWMWRSTGQGTEK